MLLLVEEDETADPRDISALGAKSEVSEPADDSDLVEKFCGWHR